jgi:hypothetical protein
VQSDGDDLVVLSARDKPEWDAHATIQIGERFYRLRDVSERPDAAWRVLAYRLRPLEAGVVVRGLVHYEAPARPGERPRARLQPEAPPDPPQPSRVVPERPKARTAARPRFAIEDGEEARLTPEGPAAAVIESLGSLPLRPRSEALGVHHRPEFPGTCVVLGDARYEVVQEQPLDTGFRYLLEPWQGEQVQRAAVVYGPALIRSAKQERRRALERARASRFASVLYPFVGLLPEERQLLACDRLGLDAQVSTLAGVGLEIGVALMLALSLPGKSASPLGPLYAIAGLVVAPALYRMLGALLFDDVAGSPLLTALFAVRDQLGASPSRSDPSVLPLTREAFWSRLQRPDRQERQPDGSLIVKSLLPHLTWGYSALNRALAGRVADTPRGRRSLARAGAPADGRPGPASARLSTLADARGGDARRPARPRPARPAPIPERGPGAGLARVGRRVSGRAVAAEPAAARRSGTGLPRARRRGREPALDRDHRIRVARRGPVVPPRTRASQPAHLASCWPATPRTGFGARPRGGSHRA